MENSKNVAVVLAAGVGKRMQSDVPKQYLLLKDKPILWYALNAFEGSRIIDSIILVVGKGEIPYCRENMVEKYGFQKVEQIIEGGSERFLSVWEALKVIKEQVEPGYVFIHDGARPFVTEKIIQDTFEAAKEYGGCVAAMPVKDTIKIADKAGFGIKTPNRKTVWMVQTPQTFEKKLIVEAYGELIENLETLEAQGVQITDDAMVVETMKKMPVKLVEASYENIKITTPEDIKIGESFL